MEFSECETPQTLRILKTLRVHDEILSDLTEGEKNRKSEHIPLLETFGDVQIHI